MLLWVFPLIFLSFALYSIRVVFVLAAALRSSRLLAHLFCYTHTLAYTHIPTWLRRPLSLWFAFLCAIFKCCKFVCMYDVCVNDVCVCFAMCLLLANFFQYFMVSLSRNMSKKKRELRYGGVPRIYSFIDTAKGEAKHKKSSKIYRFFPHFNYYAWEAHTHTYPFQSIDCFCFLLNQQFPIDAGNTLKQKKMNRNLF